MRSNACELTPAMVVTQTAAASGECRSVYPTASLKIASLLSSPFLLNIPVYQRPYSWDEDQAEQLFEDLVASTSMNIDEAADQGYFLGTILLMDGSGSELTRISPKLAPRDFDVVDGQQRLITLMTLFAVIRDLEAPARRSLSKKVQSLLLAQLGGRFFRTERFRLHAHAPDREFFEDYVLKVGSTTTVPAQRAVEQGPNRLLAVRERLKRLVGQMSEDEREALFVHATERAHVVVIVSNDIDRAHQTFVTLNERGKKLQRNDILKADVLSRLPSVDVDWAAQKWDDIGQSLGESFEQFFAHIRAIYGYKRPLIVSGVRSVVRDSGGAEPFFKTVFVPLAEAYGSILNGGAGSLPPAMSRHLHYLNRMPDGDWAPAAMLVMKDWRRDPARAARLLGEIDRIAHLMRMLCAGTGKRTRRFAEIIEVLRANPQIDSSHPVFQLGAQDVRSIAFHLKDMHKRNAKACKLLLLRLSDEMSGTITAIDPDIYTIEHVLPQRPAATSEWRKWFPTSEERARATESLGNLVLITQNQNDKARNASWSAKKQIYASASPSAPLLPITDDVLDSLEWRWADIDARELRLIEMIDRLWRTDFVSLRRAGVTSAAAHASADAAGRDNDVVEGVLVTAPPSAGSRAPPT